MPWNLGGAYSIVLAQVGRLPNPEPDEVAYYAAQSLWFVIVTDVALGAAAECAQLMASSETNKM